MKNKKLGFTLIELLVVVLIIGILAAIAVPQYQKAVLKADLHRGIALVESLYQAQQAYYIIHGNFAKDIDKLDITIPKDSSCTKTQNSSDTSSYTCNFGLITITDEFSEVVFNPTPKNSKIAYAKWLKDYNYNGIQFKQGKRYCYAKPNNKLAYDICKNMGGKQFASYYWTYFKLD